MRIVLPGALPDPRTARELLPHLPKTAPNLVAWLEQSRASRIVADPAHTYCTAWEYWQLLEHDFTPGPDQRYSAGLGPLFADTSAPLPDTGIWLVELTHLSPSRDGAVLIPARELNITAGQSDALFRAAQPFFDETGFSVHPCTPTHWQVTLPEGYTPTFPSPQLVSTTTVNDWWRQDTADRPWRRLANELQMLWFDHPVNQQRYEQGQVPINNVWLFGGARLAQFGTAPGNASAVSDVDLRLLEPALAQNWNRWLELMGELDGDVFGRLDRQSRITLTGLDQILNCTAEHRVWKRMLPGSKEAWKKWWLYQN